MERYLTTTEAAMKAGVTVATIHNWIRKGYLGDVCKQSVFFWFGFRHSPPMNIAF